MRVDINNVKVFFLLCYKSKLKSLLSRARKKNCGKTSYVKYRMLNIQKKKEDSFAAYETCRNQRGATIKSISIATSSGSFTTRLRPPTHRAREGRRKKKKKRRERKGDLVARWIEPGSRLSRIMLNPGDRRRIPVTVSRTAGSEESDRKVSSPRKLSLRET